MPDKPPVVVLASIRWDWLWQRHQAIATLFARAGYPTTFVETTGINNPRFNKATLGKVAGRLTRSRSRGGRRSPEAEGLTVYSPLVVPPTGGAFRRLNRAVFLPRVARDLRRLTDGERPVVISYPPTQTTLDLTEMLEPRLLLYDCCDDYEGFAGVPADIGATERGLARRADLVSCTSTALLEKLRPTRPDAFLNGPGVDFARFNALEGDRPTGKIQTVCYFGHIGRREMDFSILRAVAEAGYTLRLVGDPLGTEPGLLEAPGVEFLGEVPHPELPKAMRGVDAFIIPYRVDRFSRSISPSKTYECLATGKPVVATPLPDLRSLSEHVYLAEGPEGFVEALGRLPESETAARARARVEAARANSWEARFADLERRVLGALEDL